MLTLSSPCINIIGPNKMEPSFHEWTPLQTILPCWALLINFFQYPWKEISMSPFSQPTFLTDRNSLSLLDFFVNCTWTAQFWENEWMTDSPSIRLWIFCSWPALSYAHEFCHQGWIKILTGSYSLISTMNNDLTLSTISETFPLAFFMLNWTGLKSWDRHMGGS